MGAVAVALSRSGYPDREALARMLSSAPHRGNEHEIALVGRVALGVCFHSDWVMATLSRDERRAVVFGGALDNAAELRQELERAGTVLSRDPDGHPTPADILLAACARWGEKGAVTRLRGSFGGAITDGRVVWCFRDHMGTRPIFQWDNPDAYLAATEVKQVLAGARRPAEIDHDYFPRLLFGGIGRKTAYLDVERIPGGTVAIAGPEGELELQKYWDPDAWVATSKLGIADAVEGTVEALGRAVRRMLTGRDAILLSGGLDSPALAAFAARAEGLDQLVQAVTSIYPNHPSVDEREWTRMAAEHVGIPLRQHVAEAGSMDEVDEWVRVLDGPVDVISIPESAEAYGVARELGARNVLNGENAERLFHTRAYLLDDLLTHGKLRPAAREIRDLRGRGRSLRDIARRIAYILAPPSIIARRLRGWSPRLRGLPPWVSADHVVAGGNHRRPTWELSPRRRWRVAQTGALGATSVSGEADEISAAVSGVDTRRPFADVDLWQFVLSLQPEVKLPPGTSPPRSKPLLRKAMRGLLPDELIDRKDKTFFDEIHLDRAGYPALRRLLIDPPVRLDGFDYALLRERLEAEEMSVYELQWARNVARVHAFLNQREGEGSPASGAGEAVAGTGP